MELKHDGNMQQMSLPSVYTVLGIKAENISFLCKKNWQVLQPIIELTFEHFSRKQMNLPSKIPLAVIIIKLIGGERNKIINFTPETRVLATMMQLNLLFFGYRLIAVLC